MNKSGMNMERVKNQNRSLILNLINNNGPVSRKDIAEMTGLTAASVTHIVGRLLEEKLLKELGTVAESTGTAGRKKILVDIDADSRLVFTINIERDETTAAICNMKGKVLSGIDGGRLISCFDTKSFDTPEDLLSAVAACCTELSDRLSSRKKARIAGVSVGVSGLVDTEKGISLKAYGIWEKPVDIRSILSKSFDLPVIVENNVDAFATAELLYGRGRTVNNLLTVKWGPGVGSTIIIDDSIYRGRHGKTAELGHTIAKNNGKLCSCGRRGCLETEVSYFALNEIIKFSPKGFEKAYEAASEDAKDRINDAIKLFARTIVNAGTLIAPTEIILFGKLFSDPKMCQRFTDACADFDPAYGSSRIKHTDLYESESFIGPAAVFTKNMIFAE